MKKIINFSCFTCLIVGVFFLFVANPSLAANYCVTNETDLKAALNEAKVNGSDDVIKIQQGTYYGNFVYASTESFGVTIEGGYSALCATRVVDPDNTVLDGGQNGFVLALSAPDVAADFEVDGLTLQNGNFTGNSGGLAIINKLGNVTISNNYIDKNISYGGAVYVNGSDVLIIVKNKIAKNENGGIYILNCNTVKLVENVVSQNTLSGGVTIESTRDIVEIERNVVTNNSTVYSGNAGVMIHGAKTAYVKDNIFEGNHSDRLGGGLHIVNISSSVNVYSNIIRKNSSSDMGGGTWIGGRSEINLINNLITENYITSSVHGGGGLWIDSGFTNANIINNTISLNSSKNEGGGIRLGANNNSDTINFYNNIVINNEALKGKDIYLENDANNDFFPSIVNLFNNDFDQSAEGTYIQIPFPIDASNLNNEDPLFIDPDNGDFHLNENSPCIDVGSNYISNEIRDAEGNRRFMDGDQNGSVVVDIGSYEFGNSNQCTSHFDQDGDVDGSDLASFAAELNQGECDPENQCEGDYNADGLVDFGDLNVFRTYFGQLECLLP